MTWTRITGFVAGFLAILAYMQFLSVPVNAFGFGFHIGKEIVITLNVRSAWSANLYKGELPLIDGVFLQHSLNRQETLQDALGVINAIHSHSKEQRLNTRFL